MAHQGRRSSVGYRSTYETGDQQRYSTSEVAEIGHMHGINTAGYMDKNKIVNQLYDEDIQSRINDRIKNDPGFSATLHGNKPSKGAKIDASIAAEEAELLQKMKKRRESMSGRK
ncbi:hypothetical protein ACJZ2D_007182 [Fusarium nematophilum]